MKNFLGRLFFSFCLIAMTVLTMSQVTEAQQTLGSINGTVYDATGAAVPNASVTVADTDIGFTRTTTAGKDGSIRSSTCRRERIR